MTQQRLLLYDAALMATGYSNGDISEHSKIAVRRFLEDTPQEDEWLERECFIDGSLALLMRSMLREAGTREEKAAEEKFPEVRKALKAFVGGTPIPEELRFAVSVSIGYWRRVATWKDGLREVVGPLFSEHLRRELLESFRL